MIERTARAHRLNWTLLLFVAAGTTIMLLSLIVYSAYARFLYILLIAPIVCLTALILVVAAAIRQKKRLCLSLLLALATFVFVSAALFTNEDSVRASLRWLLWSHRFKAEVLAKPDPPNGELRHIEWEATGFAGVANVTVYLVFDPTDSLSAAAKSHSAGKYAGIPCEVLQVSRLESRWYSVRFYTDEEWGQRNRLNCTGPS
jgi:hypothetical protein